MKVVYLSIVLIVSMGINNYSYSQFWKKKKSKKQPTAVVSTSEYDKIVKKADTKTGLFDIHEVKEKIYLGISKKNLSKDYLLASRVSKVSDNFNVAAGQMPRQPILFNLSADDKYVFFNFMNLQNECDPKSEIHEAFERNNIPAIWKSFEIKAFNNDSTKFLIDVTKLFCSSEKAIDPFCPLPGFMGMFETLSGVFDKSRSKVTELKAFEKNIKVKSLLTFDVDKIPYTVEMTRNILVLPEDLMRIRHSDERINYFESFRRIYNKDNDKLKTISLIHRWRLEPAKEDTEKYKRGELVEPVNPIVWYVDSAIPEKWRKYIKMGIEDWQEAFEEIGFKNAIVAKDYPTKEEDPNFDPDDFRNNCYRYVTTPIKNSMGPSWIDPRTGEIICADVIFYSNVTELLRNLRFVQTSAVDKRARKKNLDDDVMGESLRNVAAHEIGHTLGLMHNFGASSSFPVDSLRSPKFTQKYGTTPSIMDYARYNYVAQPGDFEKGVRLTPPTVGVQDKFAIKWGYQPILEAEKPEDELTVLNEWFLKHKNDPMYKYGPQVFNGSPDANDLSEDLGDDVVKATEYGIKNLKYIMKNLESWTMVDNEKYDHYVDLYRALTYQFETYMTNSLMSIGGKHINRSVIGDGLVPFRYVAKEKQKEVLHFILKSIYEYPDWVITENTKKIFGPDVHYIVAQNKVFNFLMSKSIAHKLCTSENMYKDKAYTYDEYSDDIFNFVWKKSKRGQMLNSNDKNFQTLYVENLINLQSKDKLFAGGQSSKKLVSLGGTYFDDYYNNDQLLSMSAQHSFANNMVVRTSGSPILYGNLFKTHSLLKKLKNTTRNERLRNHYKVLYHKLDKFLN